MAPFFKAFFGFVKLLDQIVVDFDVVGPLNLLLFGFFELTVIKKERIIIILLRQYTYTVRSYEGTYNYSIVQC